MKIDVFYMMKETLEAAVNGVSVQPLMVNELKTKTVDFPSVNSKYRGSFCP